MWFLIIGIAFVIGTIVLVLIMSGKADELVEFIDEPVITEKFISIFGEPETEQRLYRKEKALSPSEELKQFNIRFGAEHRSPKNQGTNPKTGKAYK